MRRRLHRVRRKMVQIVTFALLATIISAATAQECGEKESVTFEKYSGLRPERGEELFLYMASPDDTSLGGSCLARCVRDKSCSGLAVAHDARRCVGYAAREGWALRQDNNANFFVKTCLQLPEECRDRWWAVESTAAYHLHSEEKNVQVILNVTSAECSAALVGVGNHRYRSAQWVSAAPATQDITVVTLDTMTVDIKSIGDCLLQAEDKYTEPESYRVANYRTLYKENQCRHDFPAKIERCSYEEYHNQTLKHVELELRNTSVDECKTSCERESRFVCRGFSYSDYSRLCYLHSEDILTLGSWLLRRAPATVYYRRVVCLDMSVECSDAEMAVTYRPRGTFRGRLYVPGRGERCAVDAPAVGSRRALRLALPLHGPCDVNFAYALTNGPNGRINKTMAYAMVMVQNNPIIQTAGDRWVRVGCAPRPAAALDTRTVDAALAVTIDTIKSSAGAGSASGDGSMPAVVPASSAVFNTSDASSPPALTMYVVRAGGDGGDGESGVVSLGELLEMRVETTDEREIEGYHLVASSRLGDSSVLLLDERGCPTGQVDFPRFVRSRHPPAASRSVQRLAARFKAFRFPNSHVVRFALMVRFCSPRCEQVECGGDARSRSARFSDTSDSNRAGNELGAGEEKPGIDEEKKFNIGEEEKSSIDEEERRANQELADVREESPSAWRARKQEDVIHTGQTDTMSPRGLVVAQSGSGPSTSCGGAAGAAGSQRVPLELEMVVGSKDLLTADTLVRADHQPDLATAGMVGAAGGAGLVCVHELLLATLVMAWLLIQLLLLVGCCVVLKRYRNFAEMASHKDYHSFDNIGFDNVSTHRRVHWPDQNVDILHVN